MPSEKNPNKRLELKTACRETAKTLGCKTKDVSKLVRKALEELGVSKPDDLVFVVENYTGEQSGGVTLKIGNQKSLELKRGTELLVQRVKFKKILEGEKPKDQEIIRISRKRWTDKGQKVLASIEI